LTTECYGYQSLYAQRFFLGALESGISPTEYAPQDWTDSGTSAGRRILANVPYGFLMMIANVKLSTHEILVKSVSSRS
jgi:hypothetical protein